MRGDRREQVRGRSRGTAAQETAGARRTCCGRASAEEHQMHASGPSAPCRAPPRSPWTRPRPRGPWGSRTRRSRWPGTKSTRSAFGVDQLDRLAIARREQLGRGLVRSPDRTDRVHHEARRQIAGRRQHRLADRQSVGIARAPQLAARRGDRRTAAPMNLAVDTAAAHERRIGRVDDRIDRDGS